LSKDGALILIHDETLNRTTNGTGYVKDHTLRELLELDAGSWFGKHSKASRFQCWKTFSELLRESDTILNIELKNGVFLYPGMEEKVIAAVREWGMTDRVVISSFNHYSLAYCHSLAPEIRTGILYMEGLYRPWDYAATLVLLHFMPIIKQYCRNSYRKLRLVVSSTIRSPLMIPSG
jgi:glycerophosphoryl diester phosphodiesterase